VDTTTEETPKKAPQKVKGPRSVTKSIIVSILCGPIGLVYYSPLVGTLLSFAFLIGMMIAVAEFQEKEKLMWLTWLITWLSTVPICVLWAMRAVRKYNRKLEKAHLPQEETI
jgi:hypothetical protein